MTNLATAPYFVLGLTTAALIYLLFSTTAASSVSFLFSSGSTPAARALCTSIQHLARRHQSRRATLDLGDRLLAISGPTRSLFLWYHEPVLRPFILPSNPPSDAYRKHPSPTIPRAFMRLVDTVRRARDPQRSSRLPTAQAHRPTPPVCVPATCMPTSHSLRTAHTKSESNTYPFLPSKFILPLFPVYSNRFSLATVSPRPYPRARCLLSTYPRSAWHRLE
jgi:hypothetical protein